MVVISQMINEDSWLSWTINQDLMNEKNSIFDSLGTAVLAELEFFSFFCFLDIKSLGKSRCWSIKQKTSSKQVWLMVGFRIC